MARFQRFKEGESIPSARWFNDIAAEVERLGAIDVMPPLSIEPGGPNTGPPIIGPGLLSTLNGRLAKTGASGIPAATGVPPTPGSATCTMYDFDPGTAIVAAESDTVYTITSAVAVNTFIIVMKIQNYWFVVVELCP
jgi:hypothetical protein